MPFLTAKYSPSFTSRKGAAPLRIELWNSQLAVEALEQWGALEQQLDDVPIACSRVWTETWLDHYGDVVPHRFALGFSGNELCAICLLTEGVDRRTGPFPITTLHLGTNGEPEPDRVCVEYNDVLSRSDFRKAFLKQLMHEVDHESHWDAFCLESLASTTFDQLGLGRYAEIVRTEMAHYFNLYEAREEQREPIELLGRSTRKRIRRNLSQYGDLTCEWAETVEQGEAIYHDLVLLHQERWNNAGERGAYASSRFYEFHRDLISRLLPKGQVVLFRVKRGKQTIGCLHHYVDRNRLLGYQNGFLMDDQKLSPGVIVDYLCIEEAARRGFDAYDFLSGDSEHKRKLSTDSHTMLSALQRRTRMRFTVVDYARRVKSWFKQYASPWEKPPADLE